MKTRAYCSLISLLAGIAVLPPALAQSQMDRAMPGMMASSSAAETPATKAYMSGMEKMHQDMSGPYTGNADIDFAQKMRAHHQGAIDMAEVQLKYGKDPQLHKLAREIIAAQKKEIAFLDKWLAQHHR